MSAVAERAAIFRPAQAGCDFPITVGFFFFEAGSLNLGGKV